MFYSSLAELPFFEQFGKSKEKLVQELEQENDNNNLVANTDPNKKNNENIVVENNDNENRGKSSNCKC